MIAGTSLFTLATKVPPEPHTWGSSRMVARKVSRSGHEQREWTCTKCALVRITVLPAGRREWRFGNGCQFVDMPDCMGSGGTTP